ncbi:hypothetical protein [Cellulomonas hominis]
MSILASDLESRREHIRRAARLMGSPFGLGLTVDVEDMYLLHDAISCYIHGADAGAIFCSHASCERDLAALVFYSEDAPPRSSQWGLGSLIGHFAKLGKMPADLGDRLRRLNSDRKALYHFGHSQTEIALERRSSELTAEVGEAALRDEFHRRNGYEGRNKDVWRFAITATLQRNAIEGVTTACLLRAWVTVADSPSPPTSRS